MERRTHAWPHTRRPPACRGVVPSRSATGRCASCRGARMRPRRRAARSARGRRSAAPRLQRAARPGPTGPRPPGGADRPHVPAGSRLALRGEGSAVLGRVGAASGLTLARQMELALSLPLLARPKHPFSSPENGNYPLRRLQTPVMTSPSH